MAFKIVKALRVGFIFLDFCVIVDDKDFCPNIHILHTETCIIHRLLLTLSKNGNGNAEMTQCANHMMRQSYVRNCKEVKEVQNLEVSDKVMGIQHYAAIQQLT